MLQNPKGSTFIIFGTVQNHFPSFRLILGFLDIYFFQRCPIVIISQLYQNYSAFYEGRGGDSKKGAPIYPSTKYPNFSVIPEEMCVLLRRRRRIKNAPALFSARYI